MGKTQEKRGPRGCVDCRLRGKDGDHHAWCEEAGRFTKRKGPVCGSFKWRDGAAR